MRCLTVWVWAAGKGRNKRPASTINTRRRRGRHGRWPWTWRWPCLAPGKKVPECQKGNKRKGTGRLVGNVFVLGPDESGGDERQTFAVCRV